MTGVALALLSWVPVLPDSAALALRDLGLALVALSALVYLAGNGFLWRRPVFPMLRTPGAPTVAIRIAFGWLGLWGVLELAGVVVARTTSLPAQNLWWADAARHVFTIGFLTMIIVGMSLRILPVFSGKTLWSAKLAYATYGLILGGVAMRLLQYPAAFHAKLYEAGSWMGVLVVAGLVLFTVNLVKTMRSKVVPSAAPAAPRSAFVSRLPVR
jgi:FtsH-binding integral membrane protein